MLEAYGYKVCMIPQPDWTHDEPFMEFGEPRLGFLVSSGNIDSMVNHYSVSKRRRDKDNYTDNGEMGKRPDRATIVYSQKIKQLYPRTPVILGGIEASLRRLAIMTIGMIKSGGQSFWIPVLISYCTAWARTRSSSWQKR